MTVFLDHKYKQFLLKALVQKLFPHFTIKEFNENIAELLEKVSSRLGKRVHAFLYKGTYYQPYNLPKNVEFTSYMPFQVDPEYDSFMQLLTIKKSYQAETADFNNYLINALGKCESVEHLEEIFPQFLLDQICLLDSRLPPLLEKSTNIPKLAKFKFLHKEFEFNLRKQILRNQLLGK